MPTLNVIPNYVVTVLFSGSVYSRTHMFLKGLVFLIWSREAINLKLLLWVVESMQVT
jgi:hypothetical protein